MNKTNFKTMLLAGLMALTGAAGFTACSDSDDDKNNGSSGGSDSKEVLFNDLLWFQNCIVRVDSLGQFVSRNYGEPLYDNDTTNVYIGVETLEEARQLFDTWIAPDAKVTATPSSTDVTVTLTDKDGKSQGEVYFKAVDGGATIAEVTTTAAVRHFRKVSFIPNSAWPTNVQEGKFIKGVVYKMDVRVSIMHSGIHEDVKIKYETMNMVCIRSQGNGVPPMLVAIGKEKESNGDALKFENLEYTDMISESDAITASQILQNDWDLFAGVFDEAGNGPLLRNEWYWIGKLEDIFVDQSVYAVKLSATGDQTKIDDFDRMWTTSSFYPLYCKTTQFYMKYGSINYVERSWDDATKTVKSEEKAQKGYYELIGENEQFLESEGSWYAVTGNAASNVFKVKGTGNHLIICDGAKLSLKHLNIPEGAELHIHSGPLGTGTLYVDNTSAPEGQGVDYDEAAGIGGLNNQSMGTLIIHGGIITAKGSDYAAGIGGGDAGHGGTLIVYDGDVKAYGGEDAAGIGGGEDGRGANVTIYGGKIEATARLVSSSVGAGIGGGQDAGGGIFTMYGGDVYAEGGVNAAGIGGGEDGTSGPITIYGGKVVAKGGDSGAGIGSGFAANCNTVTIYGGDVEAYGGNNAAGIGTGEEGKTSNINSGTIDIRGGKVYAEGKGYGAGIGAGREATCGTIGIGGGRVDAHAGSACGPWSGGIGAYHSEHEDGCHIEWAGWQRIYIGACMRLWTYSPGIGVIENVHYTENWWNFVHQRPQVAFGECNHVDGAYDITNCPYCHSYTLKLE